MVSPDTGQKGGNVELTYLIDIGSWQAMLDSLSEQLGAGIRIVNQEGEAILQSGLASLCREGMKRRPKHPACVRCCDIADLAGYDEGGLALCPYCDRAINFVFNLRTDSIQGHVIIGPVWIAEKGSRPTLARLSRKFGVGQAKFSQLTAKLRSYTLEEFRKAGEMVQSTMRVIAQTLGANVYLLNEVDQLKESLAVEKKKTWQKMIKEPLTGVYRYNYGLSRLKQEVARAERYEQSLSVVVIAIEQLRSYIDTYGREAAKAFLKSVVNLVQRRCRRTDLSVQLSDERFLLILPFTAEEGAQVVLERIRGEAKELSVSDEKGVAMETPSLAEGFASYPRDGQRGRELLQTAIQRMRH